jgi:3-demethylubiquinone-9 3-methyltransferase
VLPDPDDAHEKPVSVASPPTDVDSASRRSTNEGTDGCAAIDLRIREPRGSRVGSSSLTGESKCRRSRWNALLAGGSAEQCGWLKDRFGLSWQIVPTVLAEMIADPDRAKAKRASDAMLKMVKIDIAALQAAFVGTAGTQMPAR